MAESLDPSALTRIRQLLQPDWTHTLRARRIAAAALVVLAAVAAVRSDPHGEHTATVVATHDLTPGVALNAADVRLEDRLATTVPDGARSDLDGILGATLASPVRRGEILTDVRVLGSRLAEAAAGTDARIVPLHLADAALLDVVRAGDVVDILTADESAELSAGTVQSRVIATEAVIVLVSARGKGPTAGADRIVLVALPAAAANTVAGTALVQSVTLTLR